MISRELAASGDGATWLNFWMIVAGGISVLATSIAGYLQSRKNAEIAQKSLDSADSSKEEMSEVRRLISGRTSELFAELNEARKMIEAVEANRRKFESILYELQTERMTDLMKKKDETEGA